MDKTPAPGDGTRARLTLPPPFPPATSNPAELPAGHLQVAPTAVPASPVAPVETPPPVPSGSGNTSSTPSHFSWNAVGPTPPSDLGGGGGGASFTSADATDRVFPIRSVITLEPTPIGKPTPGDVVALAGGGSDYFLRRRDSATASSATRRGGGALSSQQQHAADAVSRAASSSLRSPPPTTLQHLPRHGSDATTSRNGQSSAGNPVRAAGSAPTSALPPTRSRRSRDLLGPMSSVQADAERHGSKTPLPIFEGGDASEEEVEGYVKGGATGSTGGGSSRASSMSRRADGDEVEAGQLLTTTRFKHVTDENGHAVITGRDVTLQRCEDEPIHTPGAVQGFGLLVAVREEGDGRYVVRYTSENSDDIIGYTPGQLFRLGNFLDIFPREHADDFLDHVDFIRDEDADPSVSGPEVFPISVRQRRGGEAGDFDSGRRRLTKLWCAAHINPAHPDLVLCEFELEDDRLHPLRPADDAAPDVPADTLQSNPTTEELTESTEILSRPLRVPRGTRRRRGEAGALQVFDIMSQVQEQLASAATLDAFLKVLVGVVKELTGFHRVMIYQFDSSFNGKVVTELVDSSQTLDLYKGLHFPAADIPRQARELYKINKVRLLYDRDLTTARMVCRNADDLETPLDMTHSYLRAMSPIHLKYLANMAVRSSMSITINAFNELWGLIACHSYGPAGMRVPFPMRKLCRIIGDTASRSIERLSYASRLQARKLINTAPTDANPSGYIIASSEDLLKLFDADFGVLAIEGETKILGHLEHSQEALAMLEYLRLQRFTSVVACQDIGEEFPDLRYPMGFTVIAGVLYVPLSVGGNDFIVFFRRGQIKDVKWAGNPYEKIVREGTAGYLEPRTSFRAWHETVIGKCREWSEEQIETAAVLCLVYGKFIQVWRQKEAALDSSRLTRLLLANSAHEVRTPLNAIINYLEIALEGSLDQETRDNLSKSHSASKSLIYVINDLLDLTKTEEGMKVVKDEPFDLPACIREATSPFGADARRKGIEYVVVERPGLPRFVYGDQRRVRQAVANMAGNALQNTDAGHIKIETATTERVGNRVRVEIMVEDSGRGMSNEQLDALFRDLEQISSDGGGGSQGEGDVGRQRQQQQQWQAQKHGQHGDDQEPRPKALGLGLATVGRIVQNMSGQLRLKSKQGEGSRFVMQLPFEVMDSPDDDGGAQQYPDEVGGSSASPHTTITITTPPRDPKASPSATAAGGIEPLATPPNPAGSKDGEVVLVDGRRGSAATSVQELTATGARPLPGERAGSADNISLTGASQRSGVSRTSSFGARSDAERLIDAIQTPLALGDNGSNSNSPAAQNDPWRRASLQDLRAAGASPTRQSPFVGVTSPASSSLAAFNPQQQQQQQQQPAAAAGFAAIPSDKTPLRPIKLGDEDEYRPSQPPPPSPPPQQQIAAVAGRFIALGPTPSRGSTSRSASLQQPQPQAPPLSARDQAREALAQAKMRQLLRPSAEVGSGATTGQPADGALRVLIAEDDPVNMRILTKRLEKAGHSVRQTVNGMDCVTVYGEAPTGVDVVLMDMQMPIVGGLDSTKMIRSQEASPSFAGPSAVASAHNGGKVTIFAVSASLVERERDTYVGAGFDGWILKPIDFGRLNTLLRGIADPKVRSAHRYVPGEWERGGWFTGAREREEASVAATTPAETGDDEDGVVGSTPAPAAAATSGRKDRVWDIV